jgi:NADPH:quinone reductase-like Zn-dependent oxidoreductase
VELVQGIDKAQGRFALILESVGGASLEGAVKRLEPGGPVVVFGNSSGEPSRIGFSDFGEAQNARLQTFWNPFYAACASA